MSINSSQYDLLKIKTCNANSSIYSSFIDYKVLSNTFVISVKIVLLETILFCRDCYNIKLRVSTIKAHGITDNDRHATKLKMSIMRCLCDTRHHDRIVCISEKNYAHLHMYLLTSILQWFYVTSNDNCDDMINS